MGTFSGRTVADNDDDSCTSGTNDSQIDSVAFGLPGKGSSSNTRAFMRWMPAFTRPAGFIKIQILTAKITFISNLSNSGTINTTIGLLDATSYNCADFATNPFARTVWATTVAWTAPSWTNGNSYDSSSLTAQVQQWFDQVGANSSTYYIGFRVDYGNAGSSEVRSANSYEAGATVSPLLTFTYKLTIQRKDTSRGRIKQTRTVYL